MPDEELTILGEDVAVTIVALAELSGTYMARCMTPTAGAGAAHQLDAEPSAGCWMRVSQESSAATSAPIRIRRSREPVRSR